MSALIVINVNNGSFAEYSVSYSLTRGQDDIIQILRHIFDGPLYIILRVPYQTIVGLIGVFQ